MSYYQDTIAALSTPPGESGIAVIRVSGAGALDILHRVYRTTKSRRFEGEWEHRRIYHGVLVDSGDEKVDEVMCAVMRAPDSYTGEDLVEVSCHGGTLVVQRVLELLHAEGAAFAQPGEFTKRAFCNGKMDLIQAEAVADLIHARSDLQRKVAQEQLAGGVSRRINVLADQTLELLGTIEANIDFIEEGVDTLNRLQAVALLEEHGKELKELLFSAPVSKPFHEGFRVAIAGPVNAGKSSLFNRLVGEQRAIVTDVPGTTRDVLREPFVVSGLLFVLHDTAGLRGGATDRIESIGVDLALDTARAADVVLFVVDGALAMDHDLKANINKLDPARSILVLNKADLSFPGDPAFSESPGSQVKYIRTSALTGYGVEALKQAMVHIAVGEDINRIARERVVLNSRLVHLLKTAEEKTRALAGSLKRDTALEILAVEAREILSLYEEATGRRYQEGLLDVIFSRFCIGK